MRIEYFQLIDRIVDLDLSNLTIRAEAASRPPAPSSRATSPAPADAGRAADRVHGADLRLADHRAHQVREDAVPRRRQGSKLRTFVTPGQLLTVSAKLVHEGSGFVIAEAAITRRRQAGLRRQHHASPDARSRAPSSAPAWKRWRKRIALPDGGRRQWLTRREAWITGIGIVSCLGEGPDAHWNALNASQSAGRHHRRSRPTSSTRWRRSTSTSRSRKRATSARWSRGSASAPMPPALRSTAPGVKGNAETARQHGHDRRRGRRRARPRGRRRHPDRHADGRQSGRVRSTSG